MKLQLTPATAKVYASRCGTWVSLEDAAPKILAVFAEEGHDPFTRRDLVAVVEAMGGSAEWADYAAIMNPMGRAPGRGYYTQGDRVGKRAPLTAETAVMEGGLTVVRKAGIIWSPAVVEADEESESFFATDVGLRRMAVADTPCFGSHLTNVEACDECPLARWCVEATVTAMAAVAARLDLETEAAIVAAAEAMLAPPASEAQASEAQASAAVVVEAAVTDDVVWPPGTAEVTMPFEGVCTACDLSIPKGDIVIHLEGDGMFHKPCAIAKVNNG
jgi:hypothetical protein